jgi:RNA polymerase sigma-70 factor (ECF subfamily)
MRGAEQVARQAVTGERFAPFVRPALINGAAGVVVVARGRVLSVMGFTVADGRIVAIDVLWDPARLADLDLSRFDPAGGDDRP